VVRADKYIKTQILEPVDRQKSKFSVYHKELSTRFLAPTNEGNEENI
jgi:hypothetical protein